MTVRHAGVAGAAAALVAGLAACGSRDTVATSLGGSSAYCQGTGPVVLADGATCTGALAQRTFTRALCACAGLTVGPDLVADGFDSRAGPWTAAAEGGAGGDVGVSGGLFLVGALQLSGSLTASGNVESGSTVSVGGDLDVAGNLVRSAATVTVGGSARVGGSVDVSSLTVGGTLTTAPGATVQGTVAASGRISDAVTVDPPCPCGGTGAVDVAGYVAQHRVTNDNAVIGLTPDGLTTVTAARSLDLPCGRFYVDLVQGDAPLTIRATGRAALFVGSGINFSGPLTIDVAEGAELDLFVRGALNLSGALQLGNAERPRALRVWTDASGAMQVPADTPWAANLYAPALDLVLGGSLTVQGAVVAAHVVNGGPTLALHYDRSIAEAGATCGQ